MSCKLLRVEFVRFFVSYQFLTATAWLCRRFKRKEIEGSRAGLHQDVKHTAVTSAFRGTFEENNTVVWFLALSVVFPCP
jgi:hypothetical protein